MAQVDLANGSIGVDVIRRTKIGRPHGGYESEDAWAVYRFWLDKGRGKYKAIDITREEVEQVSKMIQGLLGGARSKPTRKRERAKKA